MREFVTQVSDPSPQLPPLASKEFVICSYLSTGMLLIDSVLEHRVALNIIVCPLSVAGIYILSRV